ncbi:hypothetical protein TRVA0_003S01684 [Trichomonascus vanleenenianus]|uniref:uncharacterized protein n=1 Tax=Trichomonascus vanleenenianus TaxID=2268995 RepID=UPI003ECB6A60
MELSLLETPIHGTGSISIVADGHYEGKLSYNSMEELSDKKYQVECSTETGRLEIVFRQPPDQAVRLVFHGNNQWQTQAGRYRGIFHFS